MARRRAASPMAQWGTPLGYWMMGMKMTQMLVEAQMVIGMRLMGMKGFWSVAPGEDLRMVTEKMTAFTQAAMAAQRAAISGRSPDQVLTAAIKPLGRKTSSNTRRLSKRGPSWPT
ncbi:MULTISPECIES: hypothetical protein [Halomonas]|uniref:Antifreeze protein n=3 Tax=Halomonas TaxID=2745 RepID=A0AAU7KHP5_9GAMM|nr:MULTISPECIES: hypothetical protein [Halomonas]MBY6110714.1 hypothetical protein [Halomonas sp. DP1Y21-3]MCJ8284827.1 hypothetical protein [Halomonas sp.]MCO7217463.1 hypothetical protein [Halomonas sp. OfavH-34-E]USZ50000.1 hypothetical protein NKF27_00300 [Halomonas sp. DN3]